MLNFHFEGLNFIFCPQSFDDDTLAISCSHITFYFLFPSNEILSLSLSSLLNFLLLVLWNRISTFKLFQFSEQTKKNLKFKDQWNNFFKQLSVLSSHSIIIRYRSASLPRNYENHKIQKCNCNNATLTLSAGRCSSCRWVSQTKSQSLQCFFFQQSNSARKMQNFSLFFLCDFKKTNFSFLIFSFSFWCHVSYAATMIYFLVHLFIFRGTVSHMCVCVSLPGVMRAINE